MKNTLNLYGFKSLSVPNKTYKEVIYNYFTFITLQNIVKKMYEYIFLDKLEAVLFFDYIMYDEQGRPYSFIDYVKETNKLIVTLF